MSEMKTVGMAGAGVAAAEMTARRWVKCEERQPAAYGKYRVRIGTKGAERDGYLWNRAYWVTPGGSVANGVKEWVEDGNAGAAEEGYTATANLGAREATAEDIAEVRKQITGRAMTVADYEARIYLYREQAVTGYIGIGRTLNEAKAAGVVPHGAWESWVEGVTGQSGCK